MMDKELEKQVREIAISVVKEYNKNTDFTARKTTDTPTDAFAPANRRFVTLNGAVADRPKSSVATIGQTYLATDTKIPMTYDSTGWVDGVGSIVALNN